MKGHGRGPEPRRPIEREPTPEERRRAAGQMADNMATMRTGIEQKLAELSAAKTPAQWQAARHGFDVGLQNLSASVRVLATYDKDADEESRTIFGDTERAHAELVAKARSHEKAPVFPEPLLSCEQALLGALPATATPSGPVAAYFHAAELKVAKVLETVSRRDSDLVARRLQDPQDPLGSRFARFRQDRQGNLLSFLRSHRRLLAYEMGAPGWDQPRAALPATAPSVASASTPLEASASMVEPAGSVGNAERPGPEATGEPASESRGRGPVHQAEQPSPAERAAGPGPVQDSSAPAEAEAGGAAPDTDSPATGFRSWGVAMNPAPGQPPTRAPLPRPERAETQVLARDALGPAPATVPAATQAALASERGQPLSGGERWSQEVGADVTGARVVTGAGAERAAAAVGAKAFTVGERVFFGPGHSPADQGLLRHELVHVAQQEGAPRPADWSALPITDTDHLLEREARGHAALGMAATPAIMRDAEDVNDSVYLVRHAAEVLSSLGAELRRLPLATHVAHTRWRAAGAAAFMDAFVAGLGGGQAGLQQLRASLPDSTLEHAVERGRPHRHRLMAPEGEPDKAEPVKTSDGPTTWFPEVGLEVAKLVHRGLDRALGRVVTRYVQARAAALQVVWAQSAARDPGARVVVSEATIMASHPIDRRIAAVLCAGDYVEIDAAALDKAPGGSESGVCRPVSLHFLGSEGQERWLRVTPADASAEEVAASLYGDTAFAYTLSQAGALWNFEPTRVLAEHRSRLTEQERSGLQRRDDSSALSGPLAEQIALEQAGPGSIGTKDDVLLDLRDTVALMDGIAERGAPLGPHVADRQLASARARVDQRSRQLAGEDEAAVQQWASQASQQKELVAKAAHGVEQVVLQLSSMTRLEDDRGGLRLPIYVRRLILDLASAYADVARSSDHVGTAQALLAEANQRWVNYPLDLMEYILREVQQSLADLAAQGGDEFLAGRQAELRRRLAVLRAGIAADPASLGNQLQALHAEIADLQEETSIVANMDAIDSAMQVLGEENGFWATVTFQDDNLAELESQGKAYYARWQDIYTRYKQGQTEDARADMRKLREDDRFRSYLGRVQSEVHDARVAAAIGQLGAVLAITIVTMGVGSLAAGVATGAQWGARAVMWTQIGAEALTFTALNTVVFERDPTVQGVAVEFAYNLALFRMLRGISNLARGGALGRALDAGGVAGRAVQAGEMSAQLLLMTVAGLAREEITRRAQGAKPLSEEETAGIIRESVAMFVITQVLGYALRRPLLQPLERAGGKLTTGIRLARDRRAALATLGESVRASRNPDDALALLRAERSALEAEVESYRALEDQLARARSPQERDEVLREAAVSEEQVVEMGHKVAATEAHLAQMRRAEILLGLEPIGPNHVAAPRERVPELLRQHQEQGGKVALAGQDPVTRARTYEVRHDDGQRLRITERVDLARPGTQGQRPPTAAEVRSLEADVRRAIEIQERRADQLAELVDKKSMVAAVEVDLLIAGGGVAATMDYARLPATRGMAAPGADVSEIPKTFAVGGREAWRNRAEALAEAAREHGVRQPLLDGGRVGQPRHNWESDAWLRQPSEFGSNPNELGRASDLGNAALMTQFESGMVTYPGSVLSIEVKPAEGRERTAWESQSQRPLRVKVASASHPRGEFYLYANQVDAAMGRGAARSLKVDMPPSADRPGERGQVSESDRDALLADRRLVYYDDSFRHPKVGRVLVVGGGATAVWAGGAAAEVGAHVTLLGRATAQQLARAQGGRQRVVSGHDAAAELARIETELQAEVFGGTREITQGRYFDRIQFRLGELRRVRPGDPSVPDEAKKIMVEIEPGRWEAFDQVAVSIGQDPAGGRVDPATRAPKQEGPPGVGQVLGELELRMALVDGRLIALESVEPPGLIRVLGAAMSESIQKWVIAAERTRFVDLVRNVQPNEPSVPAESRKVQDSIYQLGKNIPLANRDRAGGAGPPTTPSRPITPLPPTWRDREAEEEICLPEEETSQTQPEGQ